MSRQELGSRPGSGSSVRPGIGGPPLRPGSAAGPRTAVTGIPPDGGGVPQRPGSGSASASRPGSGAPCGKEGQQPPVAGSFQAPSSAAQGGFGGVGSRDSGGDSGGGSEASRMGDGGGEVEALRAEVARLGREVKQLTMENQNMYWLVDEHKGIQAELKRLKGGK